MKTINDILEYGQSCLKPITEDYMIDAKLLLEFVLEKDSTYLFLNRLETIDYEKVEKYEALIHRRVLGEPLQYIVGAQYFMGLEFNVAPGVLIPRSDTENLVSLVIDKIKENNYTKVLDIGSGSGAIHVSLCHYLKEIHCTTVDISEDAIRIASSNAEKMGVKDRITYIKSDVFTEVKTTFDVIVSNPPYIPTEVIEGLQVELSHEPKIALDGGTDGYDFYRRIIEEAPAYFNQEGLLAFEVGHDQGQTIKQMLESAGYKDVEVHCDLSGIERVVMARYERV